LPKQTYLHSDSVMFGSMRRRASRAEDGSLSQLKQSNALRSIALQLRSPKRLPPKDSLQQGKQLMTSQNKSPAALLRTAIVFASLCCSATAIGAAAPLFDSSSGIFVAGPGSEESGTVTTAHVASNTFKDSADA
jgi:hypothetical protein